jgi:hypothetical protein
MEHHMTDTAALDATQPIHVPLWAWLVVALAAFVIFLMTLDNSLLGSAAGTTHEFFHDARHFVGAPCH